MYSASDLTKYNYFFKLLENNKFEYIIDALTGLINRKYMLEYVRYLIDTKTQFYMSIVDLDNFKSVNDQYGHQSGDVLLESIAHTLINFVGEDGLVGRFGGDEFIIVIFGKNSYEDIHSFFTLMIHEGVFRRNYKLSNDTSIFVTGTMGCASYPENAKTFDELFLMADKTLYRGKTKGRNCFIIYVHEKHKDLQIQRMHNDDVPTMMFNINSVFDTNLSVRSKIIEASFYVKDNLNLNKIFLIDFEGNLYDTDDMSILSTKANMKNIRFMNELAKIDFRDDVLKLSFGEDIKELGLASLLITRLKSHDKIYGYAIFAIERNGKVWETNEISILMYFSKAITLEQVLNFHKQGCNTK